MKNIYLLAFVLVLFCSCEDVVEVNLEDAPSMFVVDAWINNKPEVQTIKLTKSQPYFSNTFADKVKGATVKVISSSGVVYDFLDEDNDGDYTWGGNGETFGTIGETYTLNILADGNTYNAQSTMSPTTTVDSITYEREEQFGGASGIYAEFFGRDLPGEGNTYWIKTYKNGQFLNQPSEMNIAYDASFSNGADGLIFITPIRENINPVYDVVDGASDLDQSPYAVGDSIRVEIHSITEEAYYYLNLVSEQLSLGDNSLFAEPPTNVPTNIISSDTTEKPQGFFNVGAVSGLSVVVEE